MVPKAAQRSGAALVRTADRTRGGPPGRFSHLVLTGFSKHASGDLVGVGVERPLGGVSLLEPAVESLERKLTLSALSAANDNKAQAVRLLGTSERTLWYKLKRYGL